MSLNKLGLGTVQWGTHYGLTNQCGMTSPAVVKEILAEARICGVQVLDTASLYGRSESVLGVNPLDAFRVVTKTPKFATPEISDQQACQLVDTFQQSLQRLVTDKIYGLLIHHAEDLLVPGGDRLVDSMMTLKRSGHVAKVGVSIYDSDQVDAVLQVFKPDIVQLPISVFDQRLLIGGQLARMKEFGIEIHARSVFLQGLLLMPPHQIPQYFNPIRPLLARWTASAMAQGMNQVEAALSFVKNIPYIDTVLIGVETLTQFQSCYKHFTAAQIFDAKGLSCDDSAFINPSLWKLS